MTLAGGKTFSHFPPTQDDYLRATCHATSGFWFKNDQINKMYTEEEKFRETGSTVIKSTKTS